METKKIFKEAFDTRDPSIFLDLVFPKEWKPIQSRILESGVTFSDHLCDWAPRWSKVPPTIRNGETEFETHVKSCIFRSHDFLHQLWGLPIPSSDYSEESFYIYKKAQMCGEVAVLTLTEFVLCPHLLKTHPIPEMENTLKKRNAIQMLNGPLKTRSVEQIAGRLDGLLHKKN